MSFKDNEKAGEKEHLHWALASWCAHLRLCLTYPLLVNLYQPLALREEVLVDDGAEGWWWAQDVLCYGVLDRPIPNDIAVPGSRRRKRRSKKNSVSG